MNQKREKKKLFAWFRNKRDKRILHHREEAEHERQRVEELAEQQAPRRPSETVKDAEIWSAKTQDIRNKLTGKKRAAGERWNRFAATEDAGGKGR